MQPEPAAPATEAPIFIAPDAAASAPRRAEPVKAPKGMPHDPDAPYGYLTDPVTGQVRPRKTAGRQAKKQVPAPRKRPANKARTAPRPPAAPAAAAPAVTAPPVAVSNYAPKVAELIDGLWTVTASIPAPAAGAKWLGMDLDAMSVRSKAQAAILVDNRAQLAYAVGAMADHVPMIGRGVDWATAEDGPAWILPVIMALIPFAAQSAAIWRAPVAEVRALAARTDQQFAAYVSAQKAMVEAQAAAAMAAAAAPPPATANGQGTYPGEEALPGMVEAFAPVAA